MSGEAITPNWHVMLIHFPLGLLILGLLIELFSACCRADTLRSAGRWMLLFGALLSVPTAVAGAYAFRDVVRPELAEVSLAEWHQVVELSPWSPDQWEMMERHAWFNAPATGIVLLAAVLWIACSDNGRRKLYWPVLILFILGIAAMIGGAWYGGEAVYRYGVAVEGLAIGDMEEAAGQQANADDHAHDGNGHAHNGDGAAAQLTGVKYYLPPLQLHVVLAGFSLMLAFGFLALTVRQARTSGPPAEEPGRPKRPWGLRGWTWLLTAVVVLATAAAGAWSLMGAFTDEAWQSNLDLLGNPDHFRLLLHVIFGALVLLLPLILALVVRTAIRRPAWTGGLLTLLVLVVGFQVWLGVLMLYDSHSGPIFDFNAAAAEDGAAAGDRAAAENDGPADEQAAATVGMTNDLKFQPERVTIDAGQSVRWENTSDIIHTVTADPEPANEPDHVRLPEGAQPFDSGDLNPDETFTHEFTVPGRYRYFCIPHEAQGMIGEVQVRPAEDGGG